MMIKRALLLAFAILAMIAVACLPGAGPAAKIVTGELRTACKDLAAQPEPDFVLFSCDVIDATGIVVNTFEVRAPTAGARTFRAAHASR